MLRNLGKSVFFYGIASSVSKFVGIFLVPLFTYYYSPDEYGVVDLISSIVSFLAIFGMIQLESAISRYYYEVDEHERASYISTAFWVIFLASVVLIGLSFFLASLVSELLFDTPNYSVLFRLASVNILLLNLFGFFTVLLRFSNRPLSYAAVIFIQFLVTFVVSWITLKNEGLGLYPFFIGQLAGLTVGLFIMLAFFRKELFLTIDFIILRRFLIYSLPQVPAVAGNWLNMYFNRFIILGYLSVFEIGVYAVALKIASIFNLLDNAFRMAWEPFIWKKITRPDHVVFLKKMAAVITPIVFILSLLFILFEKELIQILSSPEYHGALPVSQVIVAALTIPILVQIYGIGNSIAKKTTYNTLSFLFGTICNISILFLLVPKIGLMGVPISMLVGNLVILFLMIYFSERNYPVGFGLRFLFICGIIFLALAAVIYSFNIDLIYRLLFLSLMILAIWRSWSNISQYLKTR